MMVLNWAPLFDYAFRHSHFLWVLQCLATALGCGYPKTSQTSLGYPPGISIAIDDCGQGEFAEIERDDLFGDDRRCVLILDFSWHFLVPFLLFWFGWFGSWFSLV
jgi:hypothetical protein